MRIETFYVIRNISKDKYFNTVGEREQPTWVQLIQDAHFFNLMSAVNHTIKKYEIYFEGDVLEIKEIKKVRKA